jgi:hypothetical protein
METQLGVTRDLDLGQGGLTVDAISEDAPCNFLRDGRFRKLIPERFFGELPVSRAYLCIRGSFCHRMQ